MTVDEQQRVPGTHGTNRAAGAARQGLADEDARSTSLELLQSMMDFHGAVMARIVEFLWTQAKQVEVRSRSLALTR